MQRIKVGDTFLTNNCGKAEVVEYISCSSIFVQFEDGSVTETTSAQIYRGGVRNKNQPWSDFKGFIGDGPYSSVKNKKTYKIWFAMVERCTKKTVKEKHKTYEESTVCEEWLNFQNFAKWYEDHPYREENWEIDKDILYEGNKHYSPKTCCFVPRALNIMFRETKVGNTGYRGVVYRKESGKFSATSPSKESSRKRFGDFLTAEEASEVADRARDTYIQELLEEFRPSLAPNVVKAIESRIESREGF